MNVRTLSVICLLACLAVANVIIGQGKAAAPADPLTGTWTGDWGPNANDRNQVSVDLKLDGKAVTGIVRTANRPEVALSKATFDAATGTVKMEAEAKNPRSGQAVRYVIDGKVSGSNMTGSWNHDNVKGDFKLAKK
jgi:hypothetical protein